MPQLDNLGLKENPFTKNNDYRYYYADQNRAQILESTEHLIEFSDNLQVIMGNQGMGKSLLLDTLAHRLDNNWRIAKLSVNEQVDTLSLIHEILQIFGGHIQDSEELLEALENQLSDILQLGFKPVLFLDNAHFLSVDSIRFLLQLSQQQQDDEAYIKIVLFADVAISETLQSAELRAFRDNIHIAHLDALDKEGVAGYLRHKLAIVGFDRESPFTPRIIDSIYQDSKGVPDKIDFYANKFLASSGKAEEYITPAVSAQEISEMEHLNADASNELAWETSSIEEDRIDKAEEQLNRLTEKFEEIEQLTEQTTDNQLFNEQTEVTLADNYSDTMDDGDNEPEERSLLSRFMIPGAIIAVVLLAFIILNSVFTGSSESVPEEQVNDEQIELLPLELPVQAKASTEVATMQPESTEAENTPANTHPVPVTEPGKQSRNLPQSIPEVEQTVDTSKPLLVEEVMVKADKTTENTVAQTENAQPISVTDETQTRKPDSESLSETPVAKPAVPQLKAVQPEPVIGSNKRQKIIITGKNLQPDSHLIVNWDKNSKVFSAQKTPDQWHYINSQKIGLSLTTGIETRVWQVIAENANGQRSKPLNFDVVKPFVAKMSIKAISPKPVPPSNKRQVITIKGQGFKPQTVIELKWDKNNKHFSSSLSPNQFEFVNSNEIRLRITTGTKERKWKVIAKDPVSGASSTSFFEVKKQLQTQATEQLKTVQSKSASSQAISIQNESWIKQQADNAYTMQLFSSYDQQALERFVKKYALQGQLARFASQRDGKTWYSLVYGRFASKAEALQAARSLPKELTKNQPWIRTFASIKQQLSAQQAVKPQTRTPVSALSKTKDEAWIWTQNPADYTLQLVVLSNQSSIKAYIAKHQLANNAVYFKLIKDGKPLYGLIYGSYPNKNAATQAAQKLSAKIPGSKPWVRPFADIHGMMTVQ